MGNYKRIFLESLAGTGGALTGIAGALALGLAFGIPGFILFTRENKKTKGSRNMALLILGLILMALGVILGLGLNAEGLFEGIANQISN